MGNNRPPGQFNRGVAAATDQETGEDQEDLVVAVGISEEERIRKLIKKKYRKRSGKPKPNYPAGAAAAKV